MPSDFPHRIAVVGAGIAGLTCARRLADAGYAPVVFDKSRGIGGRIATRRTAEGLRFDHGAQYATARGDAFSLVLRNAESEGHAAPWPAAAHPDGAPATPYVGVPGMSSLVKPLAAGLEIHTARTLTSLTSPGRGWRLTFAEEDAPSIEADCIALCLPAPQVSPLIRGFREHQAEIEEVSIAPCWTLMVTFEHPLAGLADVAQTGSDGPIHWIARAGSKPGRPQSQANYVIHAGPDWSRTHLERGQDDICIRMLEALAAHLGGALPPILHAVSHRWRYARTEKALGRPFMEIEPGSLFAAGDWCLGARIEAGHDSGAALADRILAILNDTVSSERGSVEHA